MEDTNDSLEILKDELAEQMNDVNDIFEFQIKDFEKMSEDISLVIEYVTSGKATLHEIAIFFREMKSFRDNLKPLVKNAKRKKKAVK